MNTTRKIDAATLPGELTRLTASVLDRDMEEIPFEANLVDELGVDSVMLLELVVALERVYGLKFAQEDIATVRSIKDTCQLVLTRASEQRV